MSAAGPSPPMRLLHVEDNDWDARLAAKALAKLGRRAVYLRARDGVAAMRFVRGEPPFEGEAAPQLIVLDLNLPGRDGREVLAELKADPALRHIPVIIMTTSDAERDVARCLALHATCYVVKPYDAAEYDVLFASMVELWGRARQAATEVPA